MADRGPNVIIAISEPQMMITHGIVSLRLMAVIVDILGFQAVFTSMLNNRKASNFDSRNEGS